MHVKILKEAGLEEALLGLSLSFNKDPAEMYPVLLKLCDKDGGHNKALESICVWIDVRAPMDFHKQLDTYRIGITKQSESTMHTLGKRRLTQEDFEIPIQSKYLTYLNSCIDGGIPQTLLGKYLPQSFLQRRILCTNYKALRHILKQRMHHKLPEWSIFCGAMKDLEHYELLGVDK